ncbi:MAG: hypothetical protein ACTSUE_08135 [Promethearchaeota archaeon]
MESNQSKLHIALKHRYSEKTGGREEVVVSVGGKKYRVDVLDESTGTAYEIQLEHFGRQFYPKVRALMERYTVVIIHPISILQHVIARNNGRVEEKQVKKRNDYYSIFKNLVSFRLPFYEGRLRFELLLVEDRVHQVFSGYRGRRPRFRVEERELVRVIDSRELCSLADFEAMLPGDLGMEFTNAELAGGLTIRGGKTRRKKIAGCITYSLCLLGVLKRAGKRGNSHVFSPVRCVV